jgi:hypothetical protein
MALIGSPLSRLFLTLTLACCSITGFCQTAPKPAAASTSSNNPAPSRPVRVIADLGQFHLDQAPAKSTANQIGAGTRGGRDLLVLCAPSLGVTASSHPTFEWKNATGAPQVTFTLMNEPGDVLFEGEMAGSSWKYPDTGPALEPGQTYTWKVSGGGMDDVPAPVKVRVQSRAAAQQVSQQLEGATADPLARAQVYLKAGLWYDTVSTLQAGIVQYPGRKDLLEQLHLLYLQVAPSCEDR